MGGGAGRLLRVAAAAAAWSLAALSLPSCRGLRVQVAREGFAQRVLSVEEFGFLQGGTLKLDVTRFEFAAGEKDNARAGFVVFQANSENGILDELHTEMKELRGAVSGGKKCPFDDPNLVISIEFNSQVTTFPVSKDLVVEQEGLYELVFVNCSPQGVIVSFTAQAEMYNPGPSYLSAGEAPLPTVLLFFFVIYGGMGVSWVLALRRHTQHVHKIHHLMTAFLVLKILSIFCFAMEKHFIKVYGYSIAWSFLYHSFRAIRAVMFMLVVVLIGTGWSVLKPALSERERKLLLFVLPLQLLANVFLAVADEMPKGSSGFRYWRFLFVWVDLLCCIAIAVPIWQHIKQLEKHVGIANKQAVNLKKLKKFRTILLTVIAFVYVTRFIVFVVGNTLNFKFRYWEIIIRELATVLFYLALANMLFPRADSAYLRAPTRGDDEYEGVGLNSRNSSVDGDDPFDQDMFFEDEHSSEFGLSSDVEMAGIRRS